MQAWARKLRYDAAALLALSRAADIAVGHTATDQVETILYRLASSPSRRALLGMRPRDGNLIRPLLDSQVASRPAPTAVSGTWAGVTTSPTTRTPTLAAVCATGSCPHCGRSTQAQSRTSSRLPTDCATSPRYWILLVDRELAGTPQIELARLRVHAGGHCAPDRATPGRPGARATPHPARVGVWTTSWRCVTPAKAHLDLPGGVRASVLEGVLRFTRTPAIEARSINWFRVVAKDFKPGEIIVESDDLQRRVRELADQVSGDYAGKDLLLIGVLKGADLLPCGFHARTRDRSARSTSWRSPRTAHRPSRRALCGS